uniref:Uncharacterized protein n=1 Tax=Arundo donax TaxID=35708 RepID=A0A0A9AU12_ARUDO
MEPEVCVCGVCCAAILAISSILMQ